MRLPGEDEERDGQVVPAGHQEVCGWQNVAVVMGGEQWKSQMELSTCGAITKCQSLP